MRYPEHRAFRGLPLRSRLRFGYALTSVVAVLASLYSVVTMVLAGFLLHERLSPRQWASVALVLGGVGLVSAG